MKRSLALLVFAAACAPTNSEVALPTPDLAVYEAQLHPFLEGACATLDCHGDPGRALRLYSDTGLRLRGDLRDTPMTPEELEANAMSLFAVDPTHPAEQHLAVLKPLDRGEGGMTHEGDNLVLMPDDAGYLCLVGYLAGASATELEDACQQARRDYAVGARPMTP